MHDGTENLKKPEKKDEENLEFTGTEKAKDTSHLLLEAGEWDSQSHWEAGISVKKKKKRKGKKLETNSQDVGDVAHEFQLVLEESDEHQSDSYKALIKQKSFKTMSAIGSTHTSTGVKDHKLEMAQLVEIPVEAEHAECDISLVKEKTKKNAKKKMNVGEKKMGAEANGPIVAKVISLASRLETTETEADKAKSHGDDPCQLEASTMVRKKRKNKLCSSLQEIGEVVAVQALPKEHGAGDEIRKLSTPQKMDEDNNATQSPLGTSAIQKKKVKRKKLKSCLQEVEVAIKSPAILEDTIEHSDAEFSRLPCPRSEEDDINQCRMKASTAMEKKGKRKKPMSNSVLIASAVEWTSTEAQPSEALMTTKKNKKKKAEEETGCKLQVDLEVKKPESSSDRAHITANENNGNTAECSQPKSVKKAKKKKLVSLNEEELMLEAERYPAVEAASTKQTHTPCKKKKIPKKQESHPVEKAKKEPILKKTVKEKAGTVVPDTVLSHDTCTPNITLMKKEKKKRKLQTEMSQSNEHAEEEMGGKKVKNGVSFLLLCCTPVYLLLKSLLLTFRCRFVMDHFPYILATGH